MKILIVGGGGREHALFWKMSQSPKVSDVFLSQQNGGVPVHSQLKENILDMSLEKRRSFLKKEKYDLIVVGPENPIANGVFDQCRDLVPVFAPSPACAQLESSKVFAKSFLQKYGFPTATSTVFDNYAQAENYVECLQDSDFPIVVKYDGLAQGKGVTVAKNEQEAKKALHAALVQRVFQGKEPANDFAAKEPKVMIEDFLSGEEASLFLICDGKDYRIFPACRDYKRANDGQEGPNTGGMGAIAPIFALDKSEVAENIQREILDPLLPAISQEIGEFRGLLFLGLMIHEKKPFVLEFNVRFGDPETQALLPLLDGDLCALLQQASTGRFDGSERILSMHKGMSSVVVVVAAEGYPEHPRKGIPVICSPVSSKKNMRIFHAGTSAESSVGGPLVSTGGRVLNVNAVAENMATARAMVYDYLAQQDWKNLWYRSDIGLTQYVWG